MLDWLLLLTVQRDKEIKKRDYNRTAFSSSDQDSPDSEIWIHPYSQVDKRSTFYWQVGLKYFKLKGLYSIKTNR